MTKILEELPKLTKTERQEIRLRLPELDNDDWLDDENPLTVPEKALLDVRLAAYAKDPNAGSTWEEVEGRIRSRLGHHHTMDEWTTITKRFSTVRERFRISR